MKGLEKEKKKKESLVVVMLMDLLNKKVGGIISAHLIVFGIVGVRI